MAHALAMIEPAVQWTAPRLANGSVQGALLIALVWSICRWGRGLRPGARTALWWLASLKLVLSLVPSPTLPVPILPAVPAVSQAVVQPVSDRERLSLPLAEPVSQLSPDAGMTAAPPPSSSMVPGAASVNWLDAMIAIWFIVVATHALRAVVSQRRLARLVGHATPVSDAAFDDVRALAARLGLRRAPLVVVSTGVVSPQVIGMWAPVVLLPDGFASRVTPDEWRMALGHELMHLRRRDLLLGWVPAVAERLFFFHPLARLASAQYLLAREVACDAAVVHALNIEAHDYGRMLVRLGVSRATPGFAVSGASPTSSLLRRRLEMLQHITTHNGPSRAHWLMLAAAVVLVPFHLTARAAEPPLVDTRQPMAVAVADRAPVAVPPVTQQAPPFLPKTLALTGPSQTDQAPQGVAAPPPAQRKAQTNGDAPSIDDLLKELRVSGEITLDRQALSVDLAKLQEQLKADLEAHLADAKLQLSKIDWSELEKQLAELRSSMPAIVSAATQVAATAAEQVDQAARQEQLKALRAQLDAVQKSLDAMNANPADRASRDASRELKVQLKDLEARMKALEASQRGLARGANRGGTTVQFLQSQMAVTRAHIQALEAQKRALPPNSTTSAEQLDAQIKAANLTLQQLNAQQQAAVAARSAAVASALQLPPSPANLQAVVVREQANVERQKRAVEEAQRRLAEAETRLRESQDRLKQQNPK